MRRLPDAGPFDRYDDEGAGLHSHFGDTTPVR